MSNHRTLLLFMIFLSLFVNETISNNEKKRENWDQIRDTKSRDYHNLNHGKP